MSTPTPAPTPAAPPPAVAAPPRRATVRLLRLGGLLLLLAGLAIAFSSWWASRRNQSVTEDAFVEAHIVNVAPQSVSGRLIRFHVEENEHVKQGQLLAEIDPVPYRDQVRLAEGKVDTAQAELRRQQAALERLRKEVPLQIAAAQSTLAAARAELSKAEEALRLTEAEVPKTIEVARAALDVARANSVLARQEYERYVGLFQEKAAPLRKAQEVERARDAAEAEVRLAEAQLAKALAARTRIEVAGREIDAARAAADKADRAVALAETGYDLICETVLLTDVKREAVEDARRGLVAAQDNENFTQIRAPFPGVVVKRYRHLGDFASPGVAILSMFNPDLLYVTANLEEDRLHGVAPGNPVELQLDAFAEPFRGRVVWIDRSTGAQFALMPRNVVSGEFTKVVQRVAVRIAIEKDERWSLLRAGLSVRAVIAHGPGDQAWAKQAARDMKALEAKYNQAPE
jgi:membrane fusion protein (multidrug efflux system)